MDDTALSSPEPILEIPEEYVPLPPSRNLSRTSLDGLTSPDRNRSILKKRGIILEPLEINGKHSGRVFPSPKTPGILKKATAAAKISNASSPSRKQHTVTFDPDKIKGSSETLDGNVHRSHRKPSLTLALRSPMVYVSSSFSRFSRTSEGSWRTRESSTQVINSSNFISFHNISYTITERKFLRNMPPKAILNNVSGIMRAGVNAILGPSGSGKTSLLDVLAGRKDRNSVFGYVLINGDRQPENFQFTSGYVVQEDRLCGTLTIRENVAMSGALRLPKDIDASEREDRVDNLLNDLGLSAVADNLIGNKFVRGVSGGERKRTSIAMELIASPAILFLDEPTTGLDAATAVSVMHILHDLSRDGRVIIMSIHQPRYSILKLCDSLTMLSKGAVVYQGMAKEALPYFSTVLGFRKNFLDNPADFFLDKIIAVEQGLNVPRQYQASDGGVHRGNPLAKEWMASGHYSRLDEELKPILAKGENQQEQYSSKYATNFFNEVYHLSIRSFKNLIRNRSAGIAVLVQNIILGLLTGVIFWRLNEGSQNMLIDRSGALFFSIICNIFSAISGMELFVVERILYLHEHASGYYRVSTYFIAKVFMDLIPLRLIPVPLYCIIAYWMVGFRQEAGSFFFYVLVLTMLNFAGACLVFCVGAMSGNLTVAQTVTAIILTLSMVFGGYIISLKSIRSWLSWLQWISIFKYGFAAIAENEFENRCFGMINNVTSRWFLIGKKIRGVLIFMAMAVCNPLLDGNEYLKELGLLEYNLAYNILGLFGIAIFTLICAYLGLRFVKRDK